MNIIKETLQSLIEPAFKVIDKVVPDKTLAAKLKHEVSLTILEYDTKLLDSRMQVIVAEAQGGSFLQRSWRPITMLTFAGLVVAHWLGFTAENLSEDQVIALLDIV